jgi:SAM-dependent methyltransferase
MFVRSAQYYDALYASKANQWTSEKLQATIRLLHPDARSLLDVACGTGKSLADLRSGYHVEGLDLSPEMLAVAQRRCPGVRLHLADMADFSLGQRYDVITCLFSSVAYVRTLDRLERSIAAMARHLAPGGVMLVEPWFTPDTYWVNRLTANVVDEPDLKISWMYISERHDRISRLDIHYQVGTPGGIEQFVERHELGLFSDAEYRGAFSKAGMTVTYDANGVFGRGMYVGRHV